MIRNSTSLITFADTVSKIITISIRDLEFTLIKHRPFCNINLIDTYFLIVNTVSEICN